VSRPVSSARYKRERREARAVGASGAQGARRRRVRGARRVSLDALDTLLPATLGIGWGAATPTLDDDIAVRLRTVMQAGAVAPAVFTTGMEAVPSDTRLAFLDEAIVRAQRTIMESIRRTEDDLMRAMLAPSPLLDPGYAVPLSWPPLPDALPYYRVYLADRSELRPGVGPETAAAAAASDAWRAGRATPLDDVMSIRARVREIMGEILGSPPRLCDCPLCNPRSPNSVRTLTLGGVTLFPSLYNRRRDLAGIGADLDLARSRARAVARATLSEARWADLARDGYLEVRDRLRPELSYRLTPGRAIEVYDDGHFASYLCVGPAVAMPVDEAFAQLYLYARDAPDELRRRGNWVEQSFRTPNAF